MLSTLSTLLHDDAGATMVEYGVMVALIAAVCIAVVGLIGKNINSAFSSVNSQI